MTGGGGGWRAWGQVGSQTRPPNKREPRGNLECGERRGWDKGVGELKGVSAKKRKDYAVKRDEGEAHG